MKDIAIFAVEIAIYSLRKYGVGFPYETATNHWNWHSVNVWLDWKNTESEGKKKKKKKKKNEGNNHRNLCAPLRPRNDKP